MKKIEWLVAVLVLSMAALIGLLTGTIKHAQEVERSAMQWKDEATASEQAAEALRGHHSRALEGKRTCEAQMRGGMPTELERWKAMAVGENAMHKATTNRYNQAVAELNTCKSTKAAK